MALIKKLFLISIVCGVSLVMNYPPTHTSLSVPNKVTFLGKTFKLSVLICISEPQFGSWRQGQWRDFLRTPLLFYYYYY